MKKPVKTRPKATPRRRRASALDSILGSEELALIRQLIADEAARADPDVESLSRRVLSIARSADPNNHRGNQTFSDFADALNQARIDANGGDAVARRALKAVHRSFDEAAERDEIHPVYLIMLGRAFAGAGLEIGNAPRAALVRALGEASATGAGEEVYRAFLAPLFSGSRGDPFDLYEAIDQLAAIFPLDFKIEFANRLVADEKALARQAAVGFLLHGEEPLAVAVVTALAAAEARGALDEIGRARIERIRPWLAPARRDAIAAAFGPAREPDSTPPAAATTKIVKLLASVRDGSGASALFACLKHGARFATASIMLKAHGVVEALLHDEISRAEMDSFEAAIRSSTPTSQIRPPTFMQLLQLALARNIASSAPPPFALVRVVEAIGLDALVPDVSRPADLIDALVAEVPDHDSAETIARANDEVANSEFAENWFEAGDEIDEALKATRTRAEAAKTLLHAYLPRRREFWAAQCALSALVLKDGSAPTGDMWSRLALVGREIGREAAFERIPLMRRIADESADVYFAQR
jgi:hypothetical protein